MISKGRTRTSKQAVCFWFQMWHLRLKSCSSKKILNRCGPLWRMPGAKLKMLVWCGEQMRLKLHEAVAEVRKERDAARKKAEEAEATCALLRTQANKMLEAAWKQVADAVNSSKEAEKRVAHAEQCQAEAETKTVQLWQKVERLLSSLENAKRPAEDAGLALARGEQMRLQLQEALTEACKEKDSATKKVAVAKATCALLRVQENQVLEATQKWTVDAEQHQAEAEAKLEDAERYRCAYKNLRKWIVHELWLQELQTNRKIYPQASEDIRDRGRRGCACPGISLGRALKVLDIIIDTFPSSMHTDPASMTVTTPAPPAQEAVKEA